MMCARQQLNGELSIKEGGLSDEASQVSQNLAKKASQKLHTTGSGFSSTLRSQVRKLKSGKRAAADSQQRNKVNTGLERREKI